MISLITNVCGAARPCRTMREGACEGCIDRYVVEAECSGRPRARDSNQSPAESHTRGVQQYRLKCERRERVARRARIANSVAEKQRKRLSAVHRGLHKESACVC